MLVTVMVAFIDLFTLVYNFLLLVRIIMSWFASHDPNFFTRGIYELTEPLLAPIRAMLPKGGMLDLSPLIVFFILQLLQQGAHYLLQHLS